MKSITHPPVLEAMQHLDAMYSEEELREIAFDREKAERDTLWVLNGAKRDGYQDVLTLQLIRRFGAIPDAIEYKMREAGAQQLLAWLSNVMDAPTIEDVFH